MTTFWANLWAPESTDGDQFIFAYSTYDIEYRQIFTVEDTGDGEAYVVNLMPYCGSGTLSIRVTDTDRTPGHREQDTV